MASGDRTIAFTEEQLEDLSETFETVIGERKTDAGNWERIPYEILEKILLDVPSYQISLNKCWVCKRWTNMILQHQFWLKKIKNYGINIDHKIWCVLQEFENNKIVTCLFYTSVYLEYCILKTPVPKFLKSIPLGQVELNGHKKDLLMTSGFLVCRSIKRYVVLKFTHKNINGLQLILKLLAARNVPLSILDHYSFLHFYQRINYLQVLKGSNGEANNITQFMGCLQTFEGMPRSMINLAVAIDVDNHNYCIDPGYSSMIRYNGTRICLHLKAGSNICNLPRITSCLSTCYVSGLRKSQISWMAEVAKKLLNPGFMLGFFNFQLDFEASKKLFYSISEAGMDLSDGIQCSSSTLDTSEKDKLYDVCRMCVPVRASCDPLEFFDSDKDMFSDLCRYFFLDTDLLCIKDLDYVNALNMI